VGANNAPSGVSALPAALWWGSCGTREASVESRNIQYSAGVPRYFNKLCKFEYNNSTLVTTILRLYLIVLK
jgi:hypothetical protein